MEYKFLIAFLICLASYIFHTTTHALEHKGRSFEESKAMHTALSVVIFTGYIAWGLMVLWDPIKINVSGTVVFWLGMVMGVLGILLVIVSTVAKQGFGEIDHLITKGVYSRTRHPMYLGLILIHVGFPLGVGSLLTLSSIIIWIPLIVLWKHWEEENLEKKFGKEYSEYKRRTFF
jgi:protein-S-isoprenylcysteine O-methyltransferase Ste14